MIMSSTLQCGTIRIKQRGVPSCWKDNQWAWLLCYEDDLWWRQRVSGSIWHRQNVFFFYQIDLEQIQGVWVWIISQPSSSLLHSLSYGWKCGRKSQGVIFILRLKSYSTLVDPGTSKGKTKHLLSNLVCSHVFFNIANQMALKYSRIM